MRSHLRSLLPALLLAGLPTLAWAAASYEWGIVEDIGYLSSLGSRVAGYPGAAEAEEYVRERLAEIGLTDLDVQEFPLLSPIDEGSEMRLSSGEIVELHAVWPNLIVGSTALPGELSGPLVYGGGGQLHELTGLPIDGAVVLLDFNCGARWLNAAMLGARAIVFIEPDETSRQDAAEKYTRVPVDLPRYYVTRQALGRTLEVLAGKEPGAVTAEVTGRVEWREVLVHTLIATIEGSDPALREEAVVLQGYYDSMSVVPALAPGAEQSCTIAALLAIAEDLVANPPGRTVYLVASPGHFQCMSGMRELADVLGAKGRRQREQDDLYRRAVKDVEKEIARLTEGMTDARAQSDRLKRLAGSMAEGDAQRYELEQTDRGVVDYDSEIARVERQVERLRENLRLMERFRKTEHIPLTISLDLTSHSRQFGLAFAGHYFNDSSPIRFLSPLGKSISAYAEEVAGESGWDPERNWFDGANPKQERNWWDYFPGRIGFESEMILAAGRPAVTFATGGDNRSLFDTPLDTADQVDAAALAFQAENLAEILRRFLSDPELDRTAFKRTKRLKLPYKLVPQIGTALEFVRRSSFLPQTPLPGAIVLVRGQAKSLMGIRTDAMTLSDGAGKFRLQGHQNGANVDAYYLDPESGRIRYAPDLGPEGERKFTRAVWQRQRQDRPVVVFPCETLSIYDLVDQRYLETLEQIFVYDATTNAEPPSFGYELPMFEPPAGETGVSVEPCAVVFAEKGESIKLTLGMGLLGSRMLLLNSTKEQPEGVGYNPTELDRIPFTTYAAARDMYTLDDQRISDFVSKGVKDPQVEDLHREAGDRLAMVEGMLAERRYDKAVALARAAWAYESSAYPNVQKTKRDVVYGVIFYLALVLSFTYFVERLLIAAATVTGRVAGTVGVFLVVFFLLYLVHPAFDLAINPLIILLAFVVLALSIVVISIVVGKFNEQLERLKQELGGIHKADMSRTSAATMAFSLGVANMRRRPTRTALTCITLVLVTFTVLSFTSVRSGVKINRLPRQENPRYHGVMIRDKVWVQLEDTIADVMRNEWGERYVVSPRAWHISSDITKKANYELTRFADRGMDDESPGEPVSYTLHSLLGLAPEETKVSGIDQKLLDGGRWLTEDDTQACILPASVAEGLDITAEDVKAWNAAGDPPGFFTPLGFTDDPGDRLSPSMPRTTAARLAQKAAVFGKRAPLVRLSGSYYEVVGLIADEDLEAPAQGSDRGFADLDNETIMPVDFSQLKPEVLNMVKEMATQRNKLGRTGVSSLLQDYEHYAASATAIVPYAQCLRLGGTTRSVAIAIPDAEETQALVNEYMQRLAVSLYATGVDDEGTDRVFLFSSIGAKSLDGVETVLIPILIAALIVLNTMLGSVWERVKEIHIFSSVGLSPTHVGALFLAESCVYANIGAIVGYLGGQGLMKVLLLTGNLGPLQTNYSSLSAVFAVVIVLLTVVGSTIWPARKAAEIAVPDIQRRWRLPEPEGDVMTIAMPFTVSGRDAPAANSFLMEFFEAYVGYAGGDFYAEDVRLTGTDAEHGEGYSLSARIWLAPYDLGVSQSVDIRTEPTEEQSIYQLTIVIHREAGDMSSWRKTNWLFLNLIRKQFLIWRTIPVEHKEAYARRTLEAIQGQPERVA